MGKSFISKKELADEMGISVDTLLRKIKKLSYDTGRRRLLSPAEADYIRRRLLMHIE
jgi:DNA-binding transcriptional MocR family regulator